MLQGPNNLPASQWNTLNPMKLKIAKTDGKTILDEFHYLQDRFVEEQTKKHRRYFRVSLDNRESMDKATIQGNQLPDGSLDFYAENSLTEPTGGEYVLDHYLHLEYFNNGGLIHKEAEYEIFMRNEFNSEDSSRIKDWKQNTVVNESNGDIVHEA